MGIENLTQITEPIIDVKDVIPGLIETLMSEMGDKLSLLITLGKVFFVLLIAYFIVLIIAKIYKIRDSRNLRRIADGVDLINQKLDNISKKSRKK